MARVNPEVVRLREEVRKRRSAVSGKIARIRRNTGVDVTDTREDPRRPPSAIKRMNSIQLKSYYSKLDAFMSRQVGFVAGSDGVALPKAKALELKRLERKYNAIGAKHMEKIRDIFIPVSGMTIAEREATIRPDSIRAQGDVVNRPYSPSDRNISNITSEKALDKIIKSMRSKVSRDFLPRELKESRRQMNKMLDDIGLPTIKAQAKKLTDQQFDTLWNYTNFASGVSLRYEIMQAQSEGRKDRWFDSVIRDQAEDMRDLLDWAKKLPRR